MARMTAFEMLAVSSLEMKDRIVELLHNRHASDIIEISSQEDRKKLDQLDRPNYDAGDVEVFVRYLIRGIRL